VHQTKKIFFSEKNFPMLHYHQKNMLNPLANPLLNQLTVNGDICNFVTAVSALSNTSQRSVYNYARRPILRTGLCPVQLLLVKIGTCLLIFQTTVLTAVSGLNTFTLVSCKYNRLNTCPTSIINSPCRRFSHNHR